ncbi:hypothetical protein V6N13_111687 [Hibiscus sabdariffa]|uniref:Strictosidine synthase conserved region domain-containing protein n=1 Tax=Hibiscus sabdariffa TaxID=183260 RepID=A0ABR2TL71_9ROSI
MPTDPNAPHAKSWPLLPLFFSALVLPVVAAILVYQLDSFDAAPMPLHELTHPFDPPLLRNERILQGAELLGAGKFQGPEDFAYDSTSQVIYTGTADGWIKRVWLNGSAGETVVEDWVNTGGRPLGIALGLNNELIVADAYKGLLNVSRDGDVEVLADEAGGVKLKLTDGVDVAKDGTVYFTDASYKYSLHQFFLDIMEVAVSPLQDSVVFCETAMRRCRKYYIQGNKKGQVEKFIDNLPGLVDNIEYDEGHYWIGLPTENTGFWDLALRYPMVRKAAAVAERWMGRPRMEKNGGVLSVDVNGKPVAHYQDVGLSMVTIGIKIKNHLYLGSFMSPYIVRLDLDQHPAQRKS